jgi:hypothetical protein
VESNHLVDEDIANLGNLNYRWARLLEQQSSNTVYRLPTKRLLETNGSLPFSFSFAANKRKLPFFV